MSKSHTMLNQGNLWRSQTPTNYTVTESLLEIFQTYTYHVSCCRIVLESFVKSFFFCWLGKEWAFDVHVPGSINCDVIKDWSIYLLCIYHTQNTKFCFVMKRKFVNKCRIFCTQMHVRKTRCHQKRKTWSVDQLLYLVQIEDTVYRRITLL